jgi:hypothetical protein
LLNNVSTTAQVKLIAAARNILTHEAVEILPDGARQHCIVHFSR